MLNSHHLIRKLFVLLLGFAFLQSAFAEDYDPVPLDNPVSYKKNELKDKALLKYLATNTSSSDAPSSQPFLKANKFKKYDKSGYFTTYISSAYIDKFGEETAFPDTIVVVNSEKQIVGVATFNPNLFKSVHWKCEDIKYNAGMSICRNPKDFEKNEDGKFVYTIPDQLLISSVLKYMATMP